MDSSRFHIGKYIFEFQNTGAKLLINGIIYNRCIVLCEVKQIKNADNRS